jgi:hypothetical protein
MKEFLLKMKIKFWFFVKDYKFIVYILQIKLKIIYHIKPFSSFIKTLCEKEIDDAFFFSSVLLEKKNALQERKY